MLQLELKNLQLRRESVQHCAPQEDPVFVVDLETSDVPLHL